RPLFRMIQPQPAPDVIEPASHRQSRRSQHHRVELFEQPLPQNLAHINRRRRQEHTFVPPFEPVHKILLVRFKKESQLLPQFKTSSRDPQQLFRLLRNRRYFRFESLQRRHQRVIGLAVVLQERFALAAREWKPSVPRRKRFEKSSSAVTNSLRLL